MTLGGTASLRSSYSACAIAISLAVGYWGLTRGSGLRPGPRVVTSLHPSPTGAGLGKPVVTLVTIGPRRLTGKDRKVFPHGAALGLL